MFQIVIIILSIVVGYLKALKDLWNLINYYHKSKSDTPKEGYSESPFDGYVWSGYIEPINELWNNYSYILLFKTFKWAIISYVIIFIIIYIITALFSGGGSGCYIEGPRQVFYSL